MHSLLSFFAAVTPCINHDRWQWSLTQVVASGLQLSQVTFCFEGGFMTTRWPAAFGVALSVS
jgi:hypothetical protein